MRSCAVGLIDSRSSRASQARIARSPSRLGASRSRLDPVPQFALSCSSAASRSSTVKVQS